MTGRTTTDTTRTDATRTATAGPGAAAGPDIRAAISAERRDLANVLAGLPPREWDRPSLCAGWRVRETVAHMTMPFRYSAPRFLAELARSRGNFNRMSDRCARRDAVALSASELVAALAGNAGHPWKPPGGGYPGALTHDVVHGLDITVALDLRRKVPDDRLSIVLTGLTAAKTLSYFGADLSGVELRADDSDWSFGSGSLLTGAAQHLLLVLCGRKLPAGLLRGEPSERFTQDRP
jgi:uncharacterized protein (TIGR03083 family)